MIPIIVDTIAIIIKNAGINCIATDRGLKHAAISITCPYNDDKRGGIAYHFALNGELWTYDFHTAESTGIGKIVLCNYLDPESDVLTSIINHIFQPNHRKTKMYKKLIAIANKYDTP